MDQLPFLSGAAVLVGDRRPLGPGTSGGLCIFVRLADLAGAAYALLGHGEKTLPAWFASLWDIHSSQYQVLTRLAQFSLAREPHLDAVQTPRAAVSLAKKVTLVIVVVVALLTIYGALV